MTVTMTVPWPRSDITSCSSEWLTRHSQTRRRTITRFRSRHFLALEPASDLSGLLRITGRDGTEVTVRRRFRLSPLSEQDFGYQEASI